MKADERSQFVEPPWEWPTWLVGFVLLPFIPAFGALVILGLTVRVGWRSRSRLWRDRLLRWLLVWVGLLLASSLGAINQGEALLGSFNFIPFVAIFAALSGVLTTVKRLRQLTWALVLPSIPICAIGLGELFVNWGDVPGLSASYHAVCSVMRHLIDWKLTAGGTPAGRMSSVFLHANFLAAYAVIVFALSLGLWFDVTENRARTDTTHVSPSRPISQRLILALAIAANLTILVLTSSRNGWGIACLTVLAFLIYHRWWQIVAAIQAGIAIVLAAAFAPEAITQPFRAIVPYAIWGRLSDQMYPDRPIGSLRLTQWRYALEMIGDRPLGGWGLRSFSPLYEAHSQFFVGHPHNLYLMLAAETGTIATFLLIVIVGLIVTRSAIALVRGQICPEARSIVFAYTIAFVATSAYHLLDVPLFQLQVNLLGWTLLASLVGLETSPLVKLGTLNADPSQAIH